MLLGGVISTTRTGASCSHDKSRTCSDLADDEDPQGLLQSGTNLQPRHFGVLCWLACPCASIWRACFLATLFACFRLR